VQCERTRGWASLAVDGELSDFERVLMEAHLESCAECAVFSVEVRSVAEALRSAALEPLPALVVVPMRRRAQGRLLQVAAVAAVVLGSIGLAGLVSGGASTQKPPRANVKPSLLAMSDEDSDRLLREVKMKPLREARLSELSDASERVLEVPI
jgi:hypothetical protein